MSVDFVDFSMASSAGSATTMSWTRPSSAASGDLAILPMSCSLGDATITPPAGWTALFTAAVLGTGTTGFVYYRELDASDTAGTTYQFTSVSRTWAGGISCYRGQAAGGAWIDTQAGITQNSPGTTFPIPSLTTTVDGCMIVAGVIKASGTTPDTITPPTSPAFTERIDSIPSSGGLRIAELSDYSQATQGLIAPNDAVSDGALSGSNAAWAVAIAPLVTGPPPPADPTSRVYVLSY